MNVTINEGTTFMISDELGDVVPGTEDGLYDGDRRYLSRYEMSLSGLKPLVLTGRPVDYRTAVHYLTNPKLEGRPANSAVIVRNRSMGDGLHEYMAITNYGSEELNFRLQLDFDVDFANVFDVKAGRSTARVEPELLSDDKHSLLSFRLSTKDSYQETQVVLSKRPTIDKKSAIYDLRLAPHESWDCCVDVVTLGSTQMAKPLRRCEPFPMGEAARPEYRAEWIRKAPKLFTDYDALQHAYELGVLDLSALRLKGRQVSKMGIVPAAGIPWYYTCFGRDSLITAYQTLPYLPEMSYGVLRNLAKYQGTAVNPLVEEEPGKILHEFRVSGVTPAGKSNYDVYYGTVDATELFIILMAELYKWTADKGFVEELKDNLYGALDWIDAYGDRDGDGYVEYERMSHKGLENQGWKDSWDSVRFADGSFAEPPIALCEVQGYVYLAKLGAADLLDILGDGRRAAQLRDQAGLLRQNFNRDFWMADEGCFCEALDKDKKHVDSVTSNAGQCLWTGIVEEEKAETLKKRLLEPDMYSGWGIRTISSTSAAYDPMSYHNGTIWPHDNALIAAGLKRYGFVEQGLLVMGAILDAGQYFAYQRLPELFCGFDRRTSRVPIDYPAASSPQAWASGSVFLALTSILGMKAEAEKKRLFLSPHFPPDVYRVFIAGVPIGDSYLSFEVLFEQGEIEVNITENPGDYKIHLARTSDRSERAG